MSYDLMVFEKTIAPKNRKDFMEWYNKQTEWKENHGYDDPAVTSIDLRNWFMEIIKIFPQMNGPFAFGDDEFENMEDESYVTDYSVGKNVIYAAFAWSLAEEAYKTVKGLAKKYNVGFFDVSSNNGEILFPDEIKSIEEKTDNRQIKKEVQQLVKKYSLDIIHIDGLNCKFKGAGFQSIIFMNQKKELGWLQYSYCSSRFSAIDSVFGFNVTAGFRIGEFSTEDVPEQFRLLKLLAEWGLSYESRCIALKCYYGFNSGNTLKKDFYDDGTVSIFANDDIEKKVKEIVTKVYNMYVPRIVRFLYGKIELLEDIFEYPYNFGYPVATALAVCKLNNRDDLFSEIIERSKKNERMRFEIPFLDEILTRIKKADNIKVCVGDSVVRNM
jgi:hypothetical protein